MSPNPHAVGINLTAILLTTVISVVFANIRAERRGPTPRTLGATVLDDRLTVFLMLLASFLILSIVLDFLDRQTLWTRLFYRS
jgi:phosphatidylglycerophosphate synthase